MAKRSFEDDKAVGREGEEMVLRFLQQSGYGVEKYGQDNGHWGSREAAGVYDAPDFKVVSHVSGSTTKPLVGKTVEVKTSVRAAETGNCALELLSNIGTGRPGWAYSRLADFLAYLSITDRRLYLISFKIVHQYLREAWHSYRTLGIRDHHFTQMTLLVPLQEMIPLCLKVAKL